MRNQGLRASTLLFIGCVIAACTSTEERFETAEQLSAQGFYSEAVGEYIRVLEKDNNFPGAKNGLVEAGGLAVDEYVGYAREAADRDRFAEASETLDRVDQLRGRARSVRVNLPLPEDYGRFRMSVDRSAVEEVTALATHQLETGNYGLAVDNFQRARNFARSEEETWRIDEQQAKAYLAWGEADMERGHFRAAAGRFDGTINLLSDSHPLGDQAFQLREEAFELGTVTVAFLPLFVVENGENAPPGLPGGLEDALLFDYWSQPPLFINTVDAGLQRRILRGEGVGRIPPTLRMLSQIGDYMDTDLIVVAELVNFTELEKDVKEERRTAKMEGGRRPVAQDTAYTAVEATLEMSAEVAFTVHNPHTRRIVDQGRVAWTVGGPIEYGTFAGNPSLLNLSSSNRHLFDDGALEDQRRIIEDLMADELAAAFADRVFGDVLRTIP